jgi:teichuronic acid biosynthesis glycosyltransferase TuaC
VVIEALASGVPVVATECGGPEEIVTQACGALSPPEDPAALAAAIGRVVQRRFERSAIRAHFESNYSASAVVPRLVELYREAIAQHDATRSASRRSA